MVRTSKRVAVAVRPMDYITGGTVEAGSIRVFMEDGAHGIRKEGGYVVFLDNGEELRRLILESPYFEREERLLSMEEIRKKRLPILPIWLKPGNAYPYAEGIEIKEIEGEVGQIITVAIEGSSGLIRLQKPYPTDQSNQRLIELQVPEWAELEGRVMQIRRPSDGISELFTIYETCNRSAGIYEMCEPLREAYSPFDEAIVFVLQGKVDRAGICWMPDCV